MEPSEDADITPSQSVSQVSTARELSIAGKRKIKPISDVWHHFSKLKGEKVQCDHCEEHLKKQKHSGTNTYWDHLKRCRVDMYNAAKGKQADKKIKISANGKLGLTVDSYYYTKDDFNRAMLESFVMNSIPFNVMDNYYYRRTYLILSQDAGRHLTTNLSWE
jgi:hypothetical protein